MFKEWRIIEITKVIAKEKTYLFERRRMIKYRVSSGKIFKGR
jgi:hypothetical protein